MAEDEINIEDEAIALEDAEDSVNTDDDEGESQSSSGDSETHPCNEPDAENCDD